MQGKNDIDDDGSNKSGREIQPSHYSSRIIKNGYLAIEKAEVTSIYYFIHVGQRRLTKCNTNFRPKITTLFELDPYLS